jgi:hypothetical protein
MAMSPPNKFTCMIIFDLIQGVPGIKTSYSEFFVMVFQVPLSEYQTQ